MVQTSVDICNNVNLDPEMCLKPVSHQPCGSRAPICDDKFLGFVRQPHDVNRKTDVRKTRSQGCRNEFSTCSFSLRFVCVF